MQVIPVFVISLERSAERRAAIRAHLGALGIEYEVFDAVDGSALEARSLDELTGNREIHHGAVGCYLSHIGIYRQMLERRIPVALIIEDDAVLSTKVVDLLQSGCESLSFDYCFLDSDDQGELGPVFYDADVSIQLGRRINAHALSAGPYCTHAYLITGHAAQLRVAHALPIIKPIDNYADLPYSIRFFAVVKPKLAWVSEYSLQSYTSKRDVLSAGLSFASLRRYPWFYWLRDIIKFKFVRRNLELCRLRRSGLIARGGKWRPLPSGREVVPLG
ncbi:MAG: glycosyltransferase family 25 protein [Gammaproteobacteria bacterium]|nr:glycosyltransferase family 25 protein [Gammaproteobacteria bacterium]